MLIISTRIEKKRLNGHRIPGELYLTGSLPNFQCCQLPANLPADLIPKRGIVPVPEQFIASRLKECKKLDCPGTHRENFAGMMWVHENSYPSAAHFFQECRTNPVQMRIRRLHCGIKPGKSWILLAHRKAIVDYSTGSAGWVDEFGEGHTELSYKPGIFAMFRVDVVEYIMGEQDMENGVSKDRAKYLTDKSDAGITLVNVLHDEEMGDREYADPNEQPYPNESYKKFMDNGPAYLPGETSENEKEVGSE